MTAVRLLVLALATPVVVLVSSALGLVFWLRHFVDVWTASVPGSLVFAFGTLVAFAAAIEIGKRRHPALALAAGIVLEWIVYALSWSFTGPAMFSPETHEIPAPWQYHMPGLWLYVVQQGFVGLLGFGAMAYAGTLAASKASSEARQDAPA